MGDDHDHNHKHDFRQQGKARLLTVLSLTVAFMILEIVVGLTSGSLALLADAGHMASDIGGIALALIALWFSSKPANTNKTFGYYRSEILAGFLNSLVLVGISIFILVEAWERLVNPPHVSAWPVLACAFVGVIVNVISLRLLKSGADRSINMKAAYLEIMSDMAGLAGVMVSSLVIGMTGWYAADPIVSALIAILILPRTWMLLSECTHILMEGAPGHIDLTELRTTLSAVPGVVDIHDLHVWTITSDHHAMSAHVCIKSDAEPKDVLARVSEEAEKKFGLDHTTIQVEVFHPTTADSKEDSHAHDNCAPHCQ